MRRRKSITPEEFWASSEPHEFRVNSNSDYAEVHKFKAWILNEIEQKKNEKSYDQQVMEKYGDYDVMTNYDKDYELRNVSPIFKFDREQLHAGEKKWKQRSDLDYAFRPCRVLGDEYLIKD